MMRVLLVGNSGAGKSTFARALAQEHALAHLDLDTIVWEPGQVAVARPAAAVRADLAAFIGAHPRWVAEGCYGDVIELALPHCSELVFLNPGRERCLAHCRARPWEPHKYASPAEQDRMLPFLLDWVAAYYERDGAMSYGAHRRIFDAFTGPKRELTM
jgi:adenylate kinase family enzyme